MMMDWRWTGVLQSAVLCLLLSGDAVQVKSGTPALHSADSICSAAATNGLSSYLILFVICHLALPAGLETAWPARGQVAA